MPWIHVIRLVLGPGLCQTGLGLARLSKIFLPAMVTYIIPDAMRKSEDMSCIF